MAFKILLCILIFSFSGTSAKPVADTNTKQTSPLYHNERALSNTHHSKDINYIKGETVSSVVHSSQTERNVWFKDDEDDAEDEENDMNEVDEMNETSKDDDKIKYNIGMARSDGEGTSLRSKQLSRSGKEKYNTATAKRDRGTTPQTKTLDSGIPLRSEEEGDKRQSIELHLWDDSDSEGQDTFQQEALTKHNNYRRLHDAPALKLDKAMSESSANYAKQLVLMGSMDHSKQTERSDEGENLFMECSKSNLPTANDATKKWYDEVCDYNFQDSKSNPGKVTGHFTQVVWKSSSKFGVGYATGVNKHDPDMKCVYVVARYKPAGNILGRFSTSVGRYLSDEASTCSGKGNELVSESGEQSGLPSHGTKNDVVGESLQSNEETMSIPTQAETLEVPTDDTEALAKQDGSNIIPPVMDSGDVGEEVPSAQDATGVTAPLSPVINVGTPPPSGSSVIATVATGTVATQPPSGSSSALGLTSQGSTVSLPTAPPVTVKPAKEESLREFQFAMLKQHNKLRIRHEAKLLHLDANLNSDAAIYARELAKKPPSKAAFRLLPGGIGQNTYSQCGERLSGTSITNNWYDEICRTGFVSSMLLAQKAAQFVQIVWKPTASIGVSYVLGMDTNGKQLCRHVVVVYKPGAVHDLEKIQEYVKPGSFDARVHCRSNQRGNLVQQTITPQPLALGAPQIQSPSPKVTASLGSSALTAKPPQTSSGTNVVTPPTIQTLPSKGPPPASQGSLQPSSKVAPPGLTGTLPKPPHVTNPGATPQTQPSLPKGSQPGNTIPPQLPQVILSLGNPTQTTKPSQVPSSTNLGTTPPKVAKVGSPALTTLSPKSLSSPNPSTAQPSVSTGPSQTPLKVASSLGSTVLTTLPKVPPTSTTVGAPPQTLPPLPKGQTSVSTGPSQPSVSPLGSTVVTATLPKVPPSTPNLGTPPQTQTSPVLTGTPQTPGSPTGNAVTMTALPGAVPTQRKPVPIPTASQTDDDFEKKALEQHNLFRKRHGAGPLKLDRQLCKEAKEYAVKISQRGPDQEPIHSLPTSRLDQSESLFVGCNADIDSADITRIWYNEVCHYDFTTYQPTGSAPIGHFAQIVWKSSTKFGIAREFRGDSQTRCVYVVARYSPKKIPGQEEDNIDKGMFTPSVCRIERKNGKGATLTQRTELFVDDALGAHNEYRLLHGVSPLVNDKKLNVEAQTHAEKLARKSINDVAMSNTLGESVYTTCDGVVTGRSVTEAWYWNVCNYDFIKNKSKDGIADHFTQLVWKGSTNVGFGVATGVQNQKNCAFAVARYFLPGNVAGQNKFNVFKGSFNEKQCAAHVLPTQPRVTPGSTVVSDGSSVNDDGIDDDDTVSVRESPNTLTDSTSQLDVSKQQPMVGAGLVPKVTATVTSATPSTVANKPPITTSSKPPAVITNKSPRVIANKLPTIIAGKPLLVISNKPPPVVANKPPPVIAGKLPPIIAGKLPPIIAGKLPPIIAGKLPPIIANRQPTLSANKPPTLTVAKPPPVVTNTPPMVIAGKPPPTISNKPQTVATKLPMVTVGKPPTLTAAKPPPVVTNTPPMVIAGKPPPTISNKPQTVAIKLPTLTVGKPPMLTAAKSPPVLANKPPMVTVGTLPTVTGKTPQQLNTGASMSTSTLGSKPINTGPSKQIFGPSKTKTQATIPSAGTKSGLTPWTTTHTTNSGTGPSKATVGSVTTSNKPTTTSAAGTLPSSSTTTGTTPSKAIPGQSSTKPWLARSSNGATSPNIGVPTSVSGSSTGTTPIGPSKLPLPLTNIRPATTTTNTAPNIGTPTSVSGSRTGITPIGGKSINTGPSKQILRPVTPATNTLPSTGGAPLTRPVLPAQNGINLNKYLYPHLAYKISKGYINDMNENSENAWPAPSSSTEMDEPMSSNDDMSSKDINSYDQDDMNEDGMDNSFEDEPLEDNKDSQSSQFNYNLPVKQRKEPVQFSAKDPLNIHHKMIRPWGNQHSKHHYRNPDLMTSEKYLSDKVIGTQQNQNSGWDKYRDYDDSMDWMNSMAWDDQALEGHNRDMSSTYKDLDYGDMTGDYNEPYGSINNHLSTTNDDSFGGNKGMTSTYRDISNGGEMMNMYKETDSKAYPKHPESFMDNIGSTGKQLEGQSKVSREFHGLSGLSYEGGVGLPIQADADELGEVRGLHKSSQTKKNGGFTKEKQQKEGKLVGKNNKGTKQEEEMNEEEEN